MIYGCRFINYHKGTTWWGMLIVEEVVYVWGKKGMRNLCILCSIFCEPKIPLKISILVFLACLLVYLSGKVGYKRRSSALSLAKS
jgi:hypothetical protein